MILQSQQAPPRFRFLQPLFNSARNLNENGEPMSDLHSCSTSVNGDAVVGIVRYINDTDLNGVDDDDDLKDSVGLLQQQQPLLVNGKNNVVDVTTTAASIMSSSITHWSDIMRQGSWWFCENGTTALLLDSVLSDTDLNEIEGYWDRLMPTVSYLGTVQVAKIYKALCVAYRAHRGQMRKSGEPFIVHVRRYICIVCC